MSLTVISDKFPSPMSDLFDTKSVEFSHGISQERCKTIIFRMTQD